eukprot:1678002-Rhodomonas_salina.6
MERTHHTLSQYRIVKSIRCHSSTALRKASSIPVPHCAHHTLPQYRTSYGVRSLSTTLPIAYTTSVPHSAKQAPPVCYLSTGHCLAEADSASPLYIAMQPLGAPLELKPRPTAVNGQPFFARNGLA